MTEKSPTQPVSVACQDLSYSINGKTLLQHINLLAEPGELLVVVGTSGAGKTTLLNNIAFRSKGGRKTGHVLFNGHAATSKTFREICNYVMTDGRMLPYLTVHETLMTAAKLKLSEMSKAERASRVECLLSELGLVKCRSTYIGGEWKKGISTGERKRVSIAIELLSEPSVLILDEPTSGLDSTLACELLSVLQRLASNGRTVICSIHQPTSQMWSQFDQLLLISRGAVIYHGKAVDAKPYFGRLGFECPKNYNPADYFLGLISNGEEEEPQLSLRGTSRGISASSQSGSTVGSELQDAVGNIQEVEMVGGLFVTSTGRPITDLNKLVTSFKESKESDVLKKRIDVIQSGAFENPGQGKVQVQRSCPGKATRSWCKEVDALVWRSFMNSIRNPIVCCVMLLVQALQGIILGGIFWQLSSDVAGQTPYLLDTKAIVENPWTQLFIDGIDGQQPLLDALENGVDGQGSQPFLELLSDERSISWLRHTITCAVGRMHLSDAGYPTFGVRPDSATVSLIDDYIAKETAGNVIGLLQQGDYQYMKRNNSDIKQIIQTETDVTYYWLAVTRWVAKDLLNPFMNCSGYPEFSDGSRRLLQLVERPQQQPRRLVTIGDIGIGDAMYDLVGVGARDFVSTTTEIVHRLHSCDNRACRWIGEKYNDTVKLGENTFTAVMSVVNILGALFFMVANLGFASYDALLTFPQERSLFNRESANGLYRASSYFLAKNIADLPFQLIPSFVLVTIYYLFIGIGTTAGQYFIYFLTCAGISFAAYGFGYLVSAASPRMEIAVLVAPIILVIWLTIAGFFLRDEQIPRWIGWLSYISFYKWGFFSLVINQFPPDGYFGLLSNRIPLLMAGITNTRLWSTMLILFSLGFCYRFVGYLALRYTNRSVGLQS